MERGDQAFCVQAFPLRGPCRAAAPVCGWTWHSWAEKPLCSGQFHHLETQGLSFLAGVVTVKEKDHRKEGRRSKMAPLVWDPPSIYFCQAAITMVERAGPDTVLVCDDHHWHELGSILITYCLFRAGTNLHSGSQFPQRPLSGYSPPVLVTSVSDLAQTCLLYLWTSAQSPTLSHRKRRLGHSLTLVHTGRQRKKSQAAFGKDHARTARAQDSRAWK